MHNDFSNTKRDGWFFTYKGSELLPYAKTAYQAYLRAELKAREKMSKMVADIKVNQRDPELEQTKREIENTGKIRESCAVFVYQFEREPEREFNLSIGDVTFFGIVRDPSEEEPRSQEAAQKDVVKQPRGCPDNNYKTHGEAVQRTLDELQACIVLAGGMKFSIQELAAMPLGDALFMCFPNGIRIKAELERLPRTTPLRT